MGRIFRDWLVRIIREEIQIGGHCGLCGEWIPDELFPRYWAIGICEKCHKEYGDEK